MGVHQNTYEAGHEEATCTASYKRSIIDQGGRRRGFPVQTRKNLHTSLLAGHAGAEVVVLCPLGQPQGLYDE